MRQSSVVWFGLFACATVAAACAAGERGSAAGGGGSPPWSKGDIGDGNAVLEPIRFQSLTLLPIVATGEVSTDDFLVLDEAMEKGVVSIDEQGPVNSLTMANRSKVPVFLLSGEVVVGGKQDRIIGKNTIITAAATETIPVFCVEHGRWSGRQAGFKSAGVLAHASLREKANFDDQGTVWKEVSEKNAKRKTSNPTDTYRHSAEQQTGAPIAAWEQHFDGALDSLHPAVRARLVGYAVALNGEVVAVDVFANPRLFAKLDRKLRRSYYAEALDVPANSDARPPSAAAVRDFVAHVDKAPAERVFGNGASDTINNDAEDAASTSVMSKTAKPTFGKAKPKAVYKSVQKRKKSSSDGFDGASDAAD